MSEPKADIQYDDFARLDLRIGKVLQVAEHPNADKLLVLQVDLGTEQRQIIAGVKQFCSPESLLGQEIVVVTNLAPRKMRGLESNGMLLAASVREAGEDGTDQLTDVVVVGPHREVPPGSGVS